MLEGTLDFLDIVCAAPDVNLRVLGVLHGESIARSLILTLPTSLALLEVLATLSY